MRKLKLVAFLGLAAAALATVAWIARTPTAEERALVAAVENGDTPAVASALRHGEVARVLRGRSDESNILLRAITSKRYHNDDLRARIVSMLLDAGAGLDVKPGFYSPVEMALLEEQPAVVGALIAKGADSRGLFKLAVRQNRLPLVQVMYASGVKPDFHDDALVLAAEQANAPMLAWLYRIGYPRQKEHGDSPVLEAATKSDCSACVAMLLNAGGDFDLDDRPVPWYWIERIGLSSMECRLTGAWTMRIPCCITPRAQGGLIRSSGC